MNKFNDTEFNEICNNLEQYHAVFYKVWNMGMPIFSTDVPTASVYLNKAGKYLEWHINPNFWKKLDLYNKMFVICHEILHIILNHGIRSKNSKENPDTINQALDITVNHSLINNFNFDRNKIKNHNNYCWTDTIFPKIKNLSTNENFEYYFNLLKKNNGLHGTGLIVDDHNPFNNDLEKITKEVIGKLNDELGNEEKNRIKDFIENKYEKEKSIKQTGSNASDLWVFATTNKIKKKRKWETVIKKWVENKIKFNFNNKEQWSRTNRRFVFLNNDLFIPSEVEIEAKEELPEKMDVWFFQDTSGSCFNLVDRFFKAALSIPKDKFNIKLFCFDTRVYKVNPNTKKLYGFGETNFECIEKYIIENCKNKYPNAVWIITDGQGSGVKPKYPKR